MRIPKIIHQTCRDKNTLPVEIIENINSLKRLNPNWEYRLYDDRDVFKFIKENYSEYVYTSAQKINKKYGVVLADLFRYLVIFKMGGVYLDLKSLSKLPLDSILRTNDSYILSQWRNRFGEEFPGWGGHPEFVNFPGGEFQQWHVISAPSHPFLKSVIERVLFNIKNYDQESRGVGGYAVLRLSGPVCYTAAILPLLKKHPFRVVDIYDLGFEYTIYKDYTKENHPWKSSDHYKKQSEPIILTP